MGKITENAVENYDWSAENVYLIEEDDYVEGGEEGVSNRQAKQLTRRTRNLHTRLEDVKKETEQLSESVDVKDTAVLRNAKEYTDTREGILNASIDTKTAATLVSAKTYADAVVAALVDNSPEALNTLQELAAALGDDPNFATTVLQKIGEKANAVHSHTKSQISDFPTSFPASDVQPWAKAATKPTYTAAEVSAIPKAGQTIINADSIQTKSGKENGYNSITWIDSVYDATYGDQTLVHVVGNSVNKPYLTLADTGIYWGKETKQTIYHSGNMQYGFLCGGLVTKYGGKSSSSGRVYDVNRVSTGKYRIIHNLNIYNYNISVTPSTSLDSDTFYKVSAVITSRGVSHFDVIISDVGYENSPKDYNFEFLICGQL